MENTTRDNTNSRRRPERGRRDRFEKRDEFDSVVLDLSRVARMTAGGRRMKFRAAVVAGDRINRVGFGLAKGVDVSQAVEKATRFAKKNMITVPSVNETIPHQIEAKFGAARLLLKPQAKGRGLVAGGTVRIICSLAGIKNISSKVLGKTGNKINNAKATIKALKQLKIK
jgi:small subunit ribosomal protein S5